MTKGEAQKYKKARSTVALKRIGTWATWWWAVSCTYVLALTYGTLQTLNDGSQTSFWGAVTSTFSTNTWLQIVLTYLILGWTVGAGYWLAALKKQKVNYKTAFRDLFLVIRK